MRYIIHTILFPKKGRKNVQPSSQVGSEKKCLNKFVLKVRRQISNLTKKFEYDLRLKADLIEIVNLSLNKLSQAEPS